MITEVSSYQKYLSTSQAIGYSVSIVFPRTGSTSAERNGIQSSKHIQTHSRDSHVLQTELIGIFN